VRSLRATIAGLHAVAAGAVALAAYAAWRTPPPLVAVAVASAGAVAGWFAGRAVAARLLRPLMRTTAALERFADGEFATEPVDPSDRSELGALARAYNRAAAQTGRALDERLRAEAEMRQFVADAGHQLRTPLTVIMGHLSAFAFRPNDAASTAAFDNMLQQSRRMRELVENLVRLAELEEAVAAGESADLAAIARRAVDALRRNDALRRIRLACDRTATVRGRESELYGAVEALVDNALKYGGDASVEVTVRVRGDEIVLEVGDRGPGLSQADLEHAFDRFYRGAHPGIEGSGLGLAIVARVAARAGGAVEPYNREGGGALFRLRFPRFLPGEQTSENLDAPPRLGADAHEAGST